MKAFPSQEGGDGHLGSHHLADAGLNMWETSSGFLNHFGQLFQEKPRDVFLAMSWLHLQLQRLLLFSVIWLIQRFSSVQWHVSNSAMILPVTWGYGL